MNESHPMTRRAKWTLGVLALLLAAGLGARIVLGREVASGEEKASHLDKGPDGKSVLMLAEGQAQALDLQTSVAMEGPVGDVLPIHGVVLDPLPFLDLDAKRRATAAALQAAQAAETGALSELSRVEALHALDRSASDKSLQEAKRAAADAGAQRAAAEGEARRAQAAWNEQGLDSVEGLADFRRVVIRLDLPLGTPVPAPMPRTLAVTSPATAASITVRVLGLAPGGSTLTGGLALLAVGPGRGLRPGLPVDGGLSAPHLKRVIVPCAAVVWSGGQAQVFVDLGGGRFVPRVVEVAFPTELGLALVGGLTKGDRVVVQGVLALQGEFDRRAEGVAIGAGGV